MKSFFVIFVVIFALFCSACGPSKAELQKVELEKKDRAMKIALGRFAEMRSGVTGDVSVIFSKEIQRVLAEAGLGLEDIKVREGELDQLVRGAYAGDARYQLGILRSKRTGPEEAQKARTEFYRVQELSEKPISAFGVSARGVDLLVAAAHHRAAVTNGHRDPVIRKVSVVRRRR